MKLDSLSTLELSDYRLTIHDLRVLSTSLARHPSLRALTIRSCDLHDPEGLSELCQALASHPVLEALDLSCNSIDDLGAMALASLIQSTASLKSLRLDSNSIQGADLAVALGRNETLQRFTINGNPLAFDSLIAFLEVLASNRSLAAFSAENCPQQGPAPFKENSSGHLSKSEAVLLVLSCVLRYSSVRSLALDIDLQAEIQLQELASVLVKHNRSLVDLHSSLIDPSKVPPSHPLHTISQALKANLWLAENEQLPKDQRNSPESALFDLISTKQGHNPRHTPTPESSFSMPLPCFSPHFAELSQSAEKPRTKRTVPGSSSRDGLINLDTYRAVRLKKAKEPREAPDSAYSEAEIERETHSQGDNSAAGLLKLVEMLTTSLHRLEADTSRSLSSVQSRLSSLEGTVSQQGTALSDCKELFSSLDETVQQLESRGKGGRTAEQGNFKKYDQRMAAIERKEAGKLALFEELGKEMDALRSSLTALKPPQIAPFPDISALEARLSRLEAAIPSNSPLDLSKQVRNLSSQVESLVSIQDSKEEEVLVLLKRLERLESRAEQGEKLKYFVSMLQKDHSQRLSKVEARLHTSLSPNPQTSRRISSLEKNPSLLTPALSVRSSLAALPQVAHLEERVAELEREQNNVAYVKKRLIETMVGTRQGRVKAVEGRLQGAERLHICETAKRGGFTERRPRELESARKVQSPVREESRIEVKSSELPFKRPESPPKRQTTPPKIPETPPKKPETPIKRPESPPTKTLLQVKGPDSPPPLPSVSSPTSSFSPDFPLKPASLNDRIVRLERLQVLPKPHPVDHPMSLSDLDAAKDLKSSYPPGEAASVLVSSLLESRGSQDSYVCRSLSPLSGSFLSLAAGEEGKGPSSELQEYLRGKGFRFPERRK